MSADSLPEFHKAVAEEHEKMEESPYYQLFNFFYEQHKLILLESEIQEIIREVKE